MVDGFIALGRRKSHCVARDGMLQRWIGVRRLPNYRLASVCEGQGSLRAGPLQRAGGAATRRRRVQMCRAVGDARTVGDLDELLALLDWSYEALLVLVLELGTLLRGEHLLLPWCLDPTELGKLVSQLLRLLQATRRIVYLGRQAVILGLVPLLLKILFSQRLLRCQHINANPLRNCISLLLLSAG